MGSEGVEGTTLGTGGVCATGAYFGFMCNWRVSFPRPSHNRHFIFLSPPLAYSPLVFYSSCFLLLESILQCCSLSLFSFVMRVVGESLSDVGFFDIFLILLLCIPSLFTLCIKFAMQILFIFLLFFYLK